MQTIESTISDGNTEIQYKLLRMNRKSLEIAVHPDKTILVKAPAASSFEAIEERIKKRMSWIKKKISYFNQFERKSPDRQYIDGETHLYLGRQYRLKIEKSDKNKVLLKNGCFCIDSSSNQLDHIKQLMDAWYKKRVKIYFYKLFDACWENFKKAGLNKPSLKLQKMNKRWGSLSCKGRVTLNVKLIQMPKECIEYVVMHELCHLLHFNHGAEFYKLLGSSLPDWKERKNKLEMTGAKWI